VTAERDNGTFRVLNDSPAPDRYAFLGVRACDLAALERLDRVLMGDQYVDSGYAARRQALFLIAVTCTECADTCFCTSMGVDPAACTGCDIQLAEHATTVEHYFVAKAGTEAGAALLAAVGASPCEGETAPLPAQTRRVETRGLREALYESFEHPRWDAVAERCLACGNCTSVCPTCFCTTVEDWSDITQHRAERRRRWDSCFTQTFSYIHGGSVRLSVKSRYRQWLTHKFAAWVDQFGSFGCIGCGRCITWCPAGIDVTEEIAALRG
jgi:ferredoxin